MRWIDADTLALAMATDDPPAVIDVRSEGEYAAGHVPGAIHVPFYSMWSGADGLPADRDRPVVVYCEHGPRAGLARFGLSGAGYRRVRVLDGHMARWREDGRPVATGPPCWSPSKRGCC